MYKVYLKCSYVVDSCYKIFVIAGQQYGAKIKWYEVYGLWITCDKNEIQMFLHQ